MNEIKNDGGSAFPVGNGWHQHALGKTIEATGMTLRDYFAAKALPAIFSDYCSAARETGFDYGWRIGLAIEAYEMADAMLEARSK